MNLKFFRLDRDPPPLEREEIMKMEDGELWDKVRESFGVNIKGHNDISSAWRLVEMIEDRGWIIYIITSKESKKVDAYKSRTTIFSRYGGVPNFGSIVEGICKTALIIDSYES